MARAARIEYGGAFYHVMARWNRPERIFRDEADRTNKALHLRLVISFSDCCVEIKNGTVHGTAPAKGRRKNLGR